MNNLLNQTEEKKAKLYNIKSIAFFIASSIFTIPLTIELSHTAQGKTYEWAGSAYASTSQLLFIAFILLSFAYINRAKSIQLNLKSKGVKVSVWQILTLTKPKSLQQPEKEHRATTINKKAGRFTPSKDVDFKL